MSMKMKDNSFSYRRGYVYATISHNLKAYSLIDSLFISPFLESHSYLESPPSWVHTISRRS